VVRGELLFAEPKTRRSRRSVPLPGIVRPHLEAQRRVQQERRRTSAWKQDLDLIVDREDGGPVNPGTLSSGWHRFCRLRGLLPVRFHDLRHGHATLMLLQGVHPKVVSERLGHASVGITLDTYSPVLPSMQAEAVRAFEGDHLTGLPRSRRPISYSSFADEPSGRARSLLPGLPACWRSTAAPSLGSVSSASTSPVTT